MQLKRSQFLALAAGALMTPLLASCGAKGGAPSSPVSIDPPGEIKPREISWLLSRAAGGAVITTMQHILRNIQYRNPTETRPPAPSCRPSALRAHDITGWLCN